MIEIDALREEVEALAALLAGLAPRDWQRVTGFKDWTVNDVVLHLYASDFMGIASTTSAEAFKTLREDMVRVGMGTADIRYRAEYAKWRATLKVQFLPNLIDLGSVVALIDAGGMNGVGEWRPERSGLNGTYRVVGGE